MAPCRASLLTLFVGVLLVNLMAVTQSVGEGVPTPQCHIVPLLGEGNHKGLPLHYITVCRGNPTCKALNLMALSHAYALSLYLNFISVYFAYPLYYSWKWNAHVQSLGGSSPKKDENHGPRFASRWRVGTRKNAH